MMHSNLTSRIVIAIGLVVVFGIGASVLVMRTNQDRADQVVLNAPAPADADPASQNAADSTAPTGSADAQMPTDQAAIPSGTSPAAPTTSNTAEGNAGTSSKSSDQASRHVAITRNSDDTRGIRVASAVAPNNSDSAMSNNNAPAPAASSRDTSSLAAAGTMADVQKAPEQAAETEATSAGAVAASGDRVAPDGQITAAVRSEIATAAPNSTVEVSTVNGVVVLTGSVASQESVDLVRLAAERVAGVKSVDSSALTVSNQ
jgi:hyperosmotically inducible protein